MIRFVVVLKKVFSYCVGYFFVVYGRLFKLVDNRILFFSFQGTYSCNPKYICEEIHKEFPEVELIWVSLHGYTDFPEYVKHVKFESLSYYRALYSSKILIENAFNYVKRPFRKRKEQICIQTMHGSLGIKRIDTSRDKKRNRMGRRSAESTDFIISNSEFENMVYKTSFWDETKILKIGHARTDVLFNCEEEKKAIRNKICKFYSIDENDKLILFAPTFSNTEIREPLDYKGITMALTEKFGGNWYILERLHPRDFRNNRKRNNPEDFNYVLDGNSYSDIQELMIAIDFAVTDYSSWIFDFILTRKPGALFVPDLIEYGETTGLYYPISETPFIVANSNAELQEKIRYLVLDTYRKEVDCFLKQKGCIDDGYSSMRASKLIGSIMKKDHF